MLREKIVISCYLGIDSSSYYSSEKWFILSVGMNIWYRTFSKSVWETGEFHPVKPHRVWGGLGRSWLGGTALKTGRRWERRAACLGDARRHKFPGKRAGAHAKQRCQSSPREEEEMENRTVLCLSITGSCIVMRKDEVTHRRCSRERPGPPIWR